MAVSGINQIFTFCPLDHEFEEKSVPGNNEIPESKWRLTYEKNADDKTWNLYLDLENYEDFKTKHFFAVGFANLVLDIPIFDIGLQCDCNLANFALKRKRSVKYLDASDQFDLQLTDLKSARIWSFENVILNRCVSKYVFKVNLTLFSRKTGSNGPTLPKIQSDFSYLLENGPYADLILVADVKEFKVHKSILCARSGVFRTMFQFDLFEQRLRTINFFEVKSCVLEKMVIFMYTGTFAGFEDSENLLFELYALADKYDVPDLKKMVAEKICRGFAAEYVDKILDLADQKKEVALMKKCSEFVRDNFDVSSKDDVKTKDGDILSKNCDVKTKEVKSEKLFRRRSPRIKRQVKQNS